MFENVKECLFNSGFFTEKKWEEEGQLFPYYIGLLSSIKEWHSAGMGVYYSFSYHAGIPEGVYDESSNRYNQDIVDEPHYAQYFYVAGEIVKYLFILYLISRLNVFPV